MAVANTRLVVGSIAGAVLTLSAGVVAHFEGYLPGTYRDPVGIPTVCHGHTGPDVKMGQVYTDTECAAFLRNDLGGAYSAVLKCIGVPMLDHQAAALVSFTFNVGEHAFCSSTLARKANYGDWYGACAELSRWNKATYLGTKIVLPGLTRRRQYERELCEGKQVKAL